MVYLVGITIRKLNIEWNPANGRLCSIRIRDKFYNYSLISAHAPTDESDNDVKDEFYDSPPYDTKVLLGDFNAKLSRESVGCASVGKHSLHEVSTDNGRRLTDWATSY